MRGGGLEMRVEGRAVVYGDSVDMDVIILGRYLVLQEPSELAKHAMEGVDRNFPQKARGCDNGCRQKLWL
jgi:3-isopropylmalate/(R)-2-methylmalate dehydratase small subunit